MKKKKIIGLVGTCLILLVIVSLVIGLGVDSKMNRFKWIPPEIDRSNNQYSVMTVNVGNSDLDCTSYKWKLCKKSVEERLTQNIQLVNPDIIALQEVLAPWQCKGVDETDSRKVCSEPQDVPQVRRLLGLDYTIVCEPRSQYECFGVRKDVGQIDGCALGDLCYTTRTTPPLNDCDTGFSISAITVRLNNGAVFDMVNIHPQSFSDSCRAAMLRQALQGDKNASSLLQQENVLLMGDLNMDPWRSKDQSAKTWQTIFEAGWAGKDYRYHSGSAEIDPPRYTLIYIIRRTLDVVVSNFAEGTCMVLGQTPGTYRLDGGSGNDHRAVYGILKIAP